jgi:serine/threonine protein kinase
MSPEQARGAIGDPRSDLYALGVVAHLAATGQLPRRTDGTSDQKPVSIGLEVPSTVTLPSGLRPHLAMAIDRCLAALPENRYQSAEALAAAMEAGNVEKVAMPAALRAWVSGRNPLEPVLVLTSSFFGYSIVHMTGTGPPDSLDPNTFQIIHRDGWGIASWLINGIGALAPLVAIAGYHATQARRLFRGSRTTVCNRR